MTWELFFFMGKVALILIALLVVVVYVAGRGAANDKRMEDEVRM